MFVKKKSHSFEQYTVPPCDFVNTQYIYTHTLHMLIMQFLHTSVFVVVLAMVVVQLSEKLIEIILVCDPVVL